VTVNRFQYIGKLFPSYFLPLRKSVEIPVGSSRKLRLETDVENGYFEREMDRGQLIISANPDIRFGEPKLKDGILEIKMEYLGDAVKTVADAIVDIGDQAGHHFNLQVPIKIVPLNNEPYLNLPKPVLVERKGWENTTRPWDELCVARIPVWSELKQIQINIDSVPFNEVQQTRGIDREAARDLLIKQIYISSIWLFLEFKDVKYNSVSQDNSNLDPRDEVFEKAIRAVTKMTLKNFKKLLR
jgi:hypothetical protein